VRLDDVRIETEMEKIADVPVVKVTGEIDVYTAPEFKSALNKAIETGATNLIIDLTNVSYMDSSGFGILLGATKRVRPKGGTINLLGCSEAITRMLKITRLDTIFGIHCGIEDALAAAKS
jgi:anti-sigma B factor antagonist